MATLKPPAPPRVIRRFLKVPVGKEPVTLYWRASANRGQGDWVERQADATRYFSSAAARRAVLDGPRPIPSGVKVVHLVQRKPPRPTTPAQPSPYSEKG